MAAQAKLQFSIKYDLWPNASRHQVYLAYTQLALWQIYERSAPFTEFNFQPELLYSIDVANIGPTREGSRAGCGLRQQRFALRHDSNGESGARSRGYNALVSSSILGCYGETAEAFEVQLSLWPPYFFDSENEDIEKYVGFGELAILLASPHSGRWYGSFELTIKGRKGNDRRLRRGSLILEMAWRPGYGDLGEVWRFTPYLYFQLYSGYAQTLLTYDHFTSQFRAGFGFFDYANWWL